MELIDLLLVCAVAFVTAAITGITGVAGGLLPAVFLTPIIGITSVLPVLAIMLLFGSISRAWINRADFHREAFLRVAIPAIPMVVLGGIFYAQLEAKMIALMLGSVVLISIPIRRIAKSYKIKTSPSLLSFVGGIFGFLAGSSTGPGLLLVPFMLGYGLSKASFVATLAVIAAMTHIARALTFGSIGLIGQDILTLGIIAGIATIPGAMLGRLILERITNRNHEILVDLMALGGGGNFLWIAFQ
ncbi:MAG: TSUP family transporter [Candidatus Puniceispirillaceae bacterium]|nr:sulfite exporter TauE/SafE family protein [Alphaproteobacteria bacterium]